METKMGRAHKSNASIKPKKHSFAIPNIGQITTYAEFLNIPELKLTYRMALRFIYAVFDTNITIFPATILYFKLALKTANLTQKLKGGQIDYDMLLDKTAYNLLSKGVQLYFLESTQNQELPKIYNNFNEKRYIVAMSDASDKILAGTYYLVTKYYVAGIRSSTYESPTFADNNTNVQARCESSTFTTNCVNSIHLANSSIKSLPFLELTSLGILTENLGSILDLASENGFCVAPENVIITTDSSTTILWCRSLSIKYSKRVEAKISQVYLNLQENNLDPYTNLYFFNQQIHNYYPPDLLTKNTSVSATQTLTNLKNLKQP